MSGKSGADRRTRSTAKVYAAVVAIAIAVNILQFSAIEARIPLNWRALSQHDTRGIDDIASQNPSNLDFWGVSLALRRFARGANLLVPEDAQLGASLRSESLYGLSGLSSISRHPYGTEVLAGDSLASEQIAHEGTLTLRDGRYPFRLYIGEGPVQYLVLVVQEEGASRSYDFVDAVLLPNSTVQALLP